MNVSWERCLLVLLLLFCTASQLGFKVVRQKGVSSAAINLQTLSEVLEQEAQAKRLHLLQALEARDVDILRNDTALISLLLGNRTTPNASPPAPPEGKPDSVSEPPRTSFLNLPHSKFTAMEPFFYNVTGAVCIRSETGGVLIIGEPNETYPLMREDWLVDVPLQSQWTKSEHIPADAEIVRGRTLWLFNTLGRQNHFGHWLLYFAVAFITIQNEYFTAAERATMDITIFEFKPGYVNQFAPMIIDDPHRIVPNRTLCYEQAYAGIPSWEYDMFAAESVNTAHPLFDGKGDVYYHEFRRRLWLHDSKVNGAPATPAERQGKIILALTYRRNKAPGASFGRNITNVAVLMDNMQTHPDFVDTLSPMALDWLDYPMAKQMEIARTLDIIAGCHGNNLMWQAIMKPGGVVIELFPHGMVLNLTGVNTGNSPVPKTINPFAAKLRKQAGYADLVRRNQFMPYLSARFNHTHLLWTSQERNNSNLAPRREWKNLDHHAHHVCSGRSKMSWKCAHLTMPPRIFNAMVRCGMHSIGKFSGISEIGEGFIRRFEVCFVPRLFIQKRLRGEEGTEPLRENE